MGEKLNWQRFPAQFTHSQPVYRCLPPPGPLPYYFECSVIIGGLMSNIFVAVLNRTELRDTHLL